jgi:hypothetical protein
MSIAAILLTKNETDLIEDFLEFYGRLLGGRNHVVVIDNGSDSGSSGPVQSAYAKHVARGGDVIVDARSFRDANLFMTEHLSSLAERYDWILPLETDEFMFDMTDRSETVNPADVGKALRETLAAQPPDVGLLRYGKFLGSLVDPADPGYDRGAYARPALQQTRFFDQGWDKLMIRSSAFVRMSMWCHHAELREGFRAATSDRLGLLHFHETGLRRRVDRAAQVVHAYNYIRPHWTLDEKLQRARQLRDAPIACGHRLNELLEYLERKATLLAFRRYLGRLPYDVAELKRYSSQRNVMPADAVRLDIAVGKLGNVNASSASWDALLYHEERGVAPDSIGSGREFRYRVVLPPEAASTNHSAYSTLLEHLGHRYAHHIVPITAGGSRAPSGEPPGTEER